MTLAWLLAALAVLLQMLTSGRYGYFRDVPKSISAHQNYYYWGPREYTGERLILLQWDLGDARRWCQDVQEGPIVDPFYGMGEEHYTILICRGLKKPLAEAWPRLKVGAERDLEPVRAVLPGPAPERCLC